MELRDSYWARSLGCSPSPASITPLSLDTALQQNAVQVRSRHSLLRAVAAAEKRLLLLPGSPGAQLELALLQYFAGAYDDAWLELGLYLERHAAAAAQAGHEDKARVLHEKIRLNLAFASSSKRPNS